MADPVGLGPATRVSDEAYEASSSTSDSNTTDGLQQGASDGFIYHKVSKIDTLAGLAIRYHVTVSDIKRVNGILSDNAMFAREHVKIPTGHLPVGEEAHVLFARLLSGYGRDASLNMQERKAPGTTSITQLPGSPSASHRAVSAFGSEAMDDDGPGTPYSRRSDKSTSDPGDVELTELSMNGGSACGYGSDRVRRRTKGDSGFSRCSSSSRHGSVGTAASQISHAASHAAEAAVGWLSDAAAAAQAALPANGLAAACLPSGTGGRRSFHNSTYSDQGSSSSGWQNISTAIAQRSSSLVQKIKQAASQPALAGDSASPGFSDMVDVVLRSSSQEHNSTSKAGHNSIDVLARGTGLGIPPPRKDTKGD